MARPWRAALAAAALALVAAPPVLYSSHRQTTYRNVRVVEDGVLYRSGQLSPAGFDRVLHDYNIKTVVTLRSARRPDLPNADDWERVACEARGLNHYRFVPKVWGLDEKGEIPAVENVRAFLAVMDDPANHPVLVHCFAGIHRTGTMCAVFRMEYHRWPADKAIAETQVYGFDPEDMHEHIEGYLRNYRPRWRRDE
ncbi:MAG: dual specificity protein phosphatase family protein [Gemmataceae bacterium]|nr:dual specificity protein phosphatase family protein [Gemmataceae bacterium]